MERSKIWFWTSSGRCSLWNRKDDTLISRYASSGWGGAGWEREVTVAQDGIFTLCDVVRASHRVKIPSTISGRRGEHSWEAKSRAKRRGALEWCMVLRAV